MYPFEYTPQNELLHRLSITGRPLEDISLLCEHVVEESYLLLGDAGKVCEKGVPLEHS